MNWSRFLLASFVVFIATVIVSIVSVRAGGKKGGGSKALNIMFGGVFISAWLLYWPICGQEIAAGDYYTVKTAILSAYQALRLFIIEGDYSCVATALEGVGDGVSSAYSVYAEMLFVIAPLLTFGFVLSFFKNLSARRRYICGFFKDIYAFSSLDERTLSLARDLKANDKGRMLIFAAVDDTESALAQSAAGMGAILFEQALPSLSLSFHSKKSGMTLFCAGEDEDANLADALFLAEKYSQRENTYLYVFSSGATGGAVLNSVNRGKLRMRRVDTVLSLINHTLYEDGMKIFDSALTGGERARIGALVVGMGAYGTEMARTLPWFCQMDGYEVRVDIFGESEDAGSKYRTMCPELMDGEHNGKPYTDNDASYTVCVHSGAKPGTEEFVQALRDLEAVSYVFIDLGTDEENVSCALWLRAELGRLGHRPVIDAICRDSDKKAMLAGMTTHSGKSYDINFIGDFESMYAEAVILGSEVEKEALRRHTCWGDEDSFWNFEYNYRSSVASVIHRKMKGLCGIPGIDKKPDERSEAELWAIRRLEHRRWNAYMRCQGFVWGAVRDDVAKVHHCLVPFDALPEKEQKKDDD